VDRVSQVQFRTRDGDECGTCLLPLVNHGADQLVTHDLSSRTGAAKAMRTTTVLLRPRV